MKKAIATMNKSDEVNEFMNALEHLLKKEVQVVRNIIKGVNKNITEQIKWKAPSFSYNGEYLVTFNLRMNDRIHLVFHNPFIARVKSKLLEGDYADRRMTYFADMQDIKSEETALVKVLKDLIKLQEK